MIKSTAIPNYGVATVMFLMRKSLCVLTHFYNEQLRKHLNFRYMYGWACFIVRFDLAKQRQIELLLWLPTIE